MEVEVEVERKRMRHWFAGGYFQLCVCVCVHGTGIMQTFAEIAVRARWTRFRGPGSTCGHILCLWKTFMRIKCYSLFGFAIRNSSLFDVTGIT